jgi:CheY-like chemotaxis protein
MHHGTLTAFSDGKDKGSAFTLALPIDTVTSSQAIIDHRRSGMSIVSGPPQPSKKQKGAALSILLVDDDETTLMILARILSAKHQIFTAKSLTNARAVASSKAPNSLDLLISDMGLPDGFGGDLLGQLRTSGQSRLQGIGLSGYGREEDIQRTLASGYAVHLVKPISRAQVEEAIHKLFL